MLNQKNNEFESFSVRKIPTILKEVDLSEIDNEKLDKIKILELCNLIDGWEKEVLFSKNGFFSIKGKDVKNKSKEFISELDRFISSKISSMNFEKEFSKQIVQEIKQKKIQTIKVEMQKYEQNQIKEWQFNVFENALSFAISRAVLYKSNEEIIISSYNNAQNVIKLISQQEKWDKKTYKSKKEAFDSKFYFYLISAFIQDKNSIAVHYFDKYKDYLFDDEKVKLEKNIKEFKVNVIAFNFAKELFSYNLSEEEQQKELKTIEDEQIKNAATKYLLEFVASDKKSKKEEEKQKNLDNWQEIIDMVKQDINRSYLYIDYSLPNISITSKKHYISAMKENNCIVTDKKKFIELISEFFDDFISFKQKDIADYQAYLSVEDYNLFLNFQSLNIPEFEKINIDYKYLISRIKDINLKKQDDKYDFIKLMFSSLSEYKKNNKKDADLKTRNEIIDLILNRFKENKK